MSAYAQGTRIGSRAHIVGSIRVTGLCNIHALVTNLGQSLSFCRGADDTSLPLAVMICTL